MVNKTLSPVWVHFLLLDRLAPADGIGQAAGRGKAHEAERLLRRVQMRDEFLRRGDLKRGLAAFDHHVDQLRTSQPVGEHHPVGDDLRLHGQHDQVNFEFRAVDVKGEGRCFVDKPGDLPVGGAIRDPEDIAAAGAARLDEAELIALGCVAARVIKDAPVGALADGPVLLRPVMRDLGESGRGHQKKQNEGDLFHERCDSGDIHSPDFHYSLSTINPILRFGFSSSGGGGSMSRRMASKIAAI